MRAAPYQALVDACRDQGWRITRAKNGLMLWPPNGARPIACHAILHGTVDSRAVKNLRSQLRAGGLEI